ncbi:hypothetical protein [Hippea alviniae]|uniref:hypothetical protein n=1 Tax=Hippea alviniae TaxID=1279027 RepID=UPI0003B3BD74|nr:hypothetical protein [Hippea alviniae]
MDLKDRILHLLDKYTDNKGRIDCTKAIAVAKRLKIEPSFVGKVASEFGIRIKNCELGQFGDKRIDSFDKKTYEALTVLADNNRIKCEDCWKVANRFGMVKVRSSIKNSNLEVIHCQLNCFKNKERPRLKAEVELFLKSKATKDKINDKAFEILKAVIELKNLKDTSCRLGVDEEVIIETIEKINKVFNAVCVKIEKDGRVTVYPLAGEILSKFEKLKKDIENFSKKRFVEIFYGDRKYKDIDKYYS